MATMLVTVNMVGTGIFLLPVTMASVGSISIWGWLVAAVGAGALGLMFAYLGATDPQPGGPYAYARSTFGPYLGFQTNYVYWTANLVGNIAVATTVTSYFTEFIPVLKSQWMGAGFTIILIWLATACNIIGPRCVGIVTGWTTAIAIIPLTAVAVCGWYWFEPKIFLEGWNPNHISNMDALATSATFGLWAFIGIESASVASGVIENPKKNVPLATLLGLLIATALYVSTCTVLMGIIPAEQLAKSDAPFSIAVKQAIGPIGAMVIGVAAILKAGGSLVGWTLTIAQSAESAAKDGIFPGIYGRPNRFGVPVWNFIISAALMSVIVLLTASPSLTQQFNKIIDTAIILTLLPYLYSAVSFMASCRNREFKGWRGVGAWLVTILAMSYCLFALVGSENELVHDAMFLLFLSVPIYLAFLPRKGC
ncbi:amino acid permease [Cerasicoccus frondis]|uniref:amino acid permease n=1 Tax=Cerasicoccus frondis TaxID=490090 RepID=UPI002852B34C|nr:amino acid permease [Cerasicoccus frondis]